MAIITLTTDFGLKDHYVAVVKGTIYSELPNITIVDVSHKVTPFNYNEASYIIKNTYQSFPKGTIHIIGVDSETNRDTPHIAMLLDDHYFICADNGILSILTASIHPEKIIEITTHKQINDNFPVKNVFTKVACHLARGGSLDLIGRSFNSLKEFTNVTPIINHDKTMIVGHIQYIDNYGNVISNITKELINSIAQGRNTTVTIRGFVFNHIINSYGDFIDYDIPKEKRFIDGKKIALYNSNNYLEIAIYKGSLESSGGASSLLGINYRDNITVTFTN